MPSRQTDYARFLRRTMNNTEFRVWCRLRGRKLDGFKFRRQHPIGEYVVDFYCPAARLVVEIDGPGHDFTEAYDNRKDTWLFAEGYHVLRFSVSLVDEGVDSVAATILRELTDNHPPELASPHPAELAPRAEPPSPQAGKQI